MGRPLMDEYYEERKDTRLISAEQLKSAGYQQTENAVEDEYEDVNSDNEIEETSREVIKIVNVHKTYLLGIEGVPALRGVNVTV